MNFFLEADISNLALKLLIALKSNREQEVQEMRRSDVKSEYLRHCSPLGNRSLACYRIRNSGNFGKYSKSLKDDENFCRKGCSQRCTLLQFQSYTYLVRWSFEIMVRWPLSQKDMGNDASSTTGQGGLRLQIYFFSSKMLSLCNNMVSYSHV